MSLLSKLARAMGLVDESRSDAADRQTDRTALDDDRMARVADTHRNPDTNVPVTTDGRYHAAGYSFATEDQALNFLKRRTSASANEPALQLASRLEENKLVDRPDGPLSARQMQRQDPTGKPAAPVPDPVDGIVMTVDGRFRAGGYSFTTEH